MAASATMARRRHTRAALERTTPRHTGPTVTWHLQCDSTPSPDPVQYVRQVLPDGPLFELAAYRWEQRPRRWVSIGRTDELDIVLDNETVSETHCFLVRDRKTGRLQVSDADSKNGVYINGTRVTDAEIKPGDLLSLGAVVLLVCGGAGIEQRPTLSGHCLHDILQQAIQLYGSNASAAKALKIAESTLASWIEKEKFKVA